MTYSSDAEAYFSGAAPQSAQAARPPQQPAAPTGAPAGADAPAKTFRPQHKVFGGKGAVQFEADETRSGVPTIRIEAAPALGPKQYNWKEKVIIQVTTQELPLLAGVLLGAMPEMEGKHHGPEKNKGFSIKSQPGGFFIRVLQAGRSPVAVPVNQADGFFLLSLVLKQLSAAAFDLSPESVAISLRGMLAATAAARQPPRN